MRATIATMLKISHCRHWLAAIACLTAIGNAVAEPLAAPGDMRLRNDLQLLNDSGVFDISLSAWPVSLGDVHRATDAAVIDGESDAVARALERVRRQLEWELAPGEFDFVFGASAASEPRIIRTFEDTPRGELEGFAKLSWVGERFAINLEGRFVNDPIDGDEFRPDGTYVGAALGNWIVTAGWQERWFGPGRDGSLILGSNARPSPGIMLQRNNTTPFETKWLSWLGPWSFTTFMTQLDDDREIKDALLFGIRGSFRPVKGLEIGITRTAQWCGEDRPCDLSTFGDLLLGNDNRGVNVDPEDEPGNQLAGLDIRWSLPADIPVAAYMQWIGEDGRPGSGLIGSWMRQVGVEFWGRFGDFDHRTHFEVSDTLAREGGFGFSDEKPNVAYNHPIYKTGYRYNQRVIGHPADGDSLSYSLGSTLVQSAGHTWNVSLRYMEINRAGSPNERHTLSPTPQEIADVQISHSRETRFGRFDLGLGYASIDDELTGVSDKQTSVFLRWSSR